MKFLNLYLAPGPFSLVVQSSDHRKSIPKKLVCAKYPRKPGENHLKNPSKVVFGHCYVFSNPPNNGPMLPFGILSLLTIELLQQTGCNLVELGHVKICSVNHYFLKKKLVLKIFYINL